MPEGEIYFIGFLNNVDSTIINLRLDYGFKIEKMHIKDAESFISLVPIYNQFTLFNKGCVKDKHVYYISNSFKVKDVSSCTFPPEIFKFGKKYLNVHENGYLNNIIKIMRLFKKGSISLPIELYYYYENSVPKMKSCSMRSKYGACNLFSLDDMELKELQELIQNKDYYDCISNKVINIALSFFMDNRGDKRCFNLYKVYEIIRKDCGSEANMIDYLGTSRNKLRKFRETMNHLCGMHSRHAESRHGKSMDINEAEELIRNLLKMWINLKIGKKMKY